MDETVYIHELETHEGYTECVKDIKCPHCGGGLEVVSTHTVFWGDECDYVRTLLCTGCSRMKKTDASSYGYDDDVTDRNGVHKGNYTRIREAAADTKGWCHEKDGTVVWCIGGETECLNGFHAVIGCRFCTFLS